MLSVGLTVPPKVLETAREVCSLSRLVARDWVREACGEVKRRKANQWLQSIDEAAIVVQHMGYRAIAIKRWGATNYSLIEFDQP